MSSIIREASFDPFMTPIGFNRTMVFATNREADLYGVVLPRDNLYYFELFYSEGQIFYLQILMCEFIQELIEGMILS